MVAEVLARFLDEAASYQVTPLGSGGGFSGAALWRIEGPEGVFCLKQWPATFTQQNIAEAHAAVARARALPFIPQYHQTRFEVGRFGDRPSIISWGDQFWDLCTWMPGDADFHDLPSVHRIQAATTALAQYHLAQDTAKTVVYSSNIGTSHLYRAGPSPGIALRRQMEERWRQLHPEALQPHRDLAHLPAELFELLHRAYHLVSRLLPDVRPLLEPWRQRVFPLIACHGDPWHDHVLFTGDNVTGLIDFGCLKWDHPATDLARMLGSLAEDEEELWQAGLEAYRSVRPFDEDELVRVLDRTGTIVALANWVRWIALERREVVEADKVMVRLRRLVGRVARWPLAA